jgi:hypothetical protein
MPREKDRESNLMENEPGIRLQISKLVDKLEFSTISAQKSRK